MRVKLEKKKNNRGQNWEKKGSKKTGIPGGTRTHNRLIRSQTPYPLGHGYYHVQSSTNQSIDI